MNKYKFLENMTYLMQYALIIHGIAFFLFFAWDIVNLNFDGVFVDSAWVILTIGIYKYNFTFIKR